MNNEIEVKYRLYQEVGKSWEIALTEEHNCGLVWMPISQVPETNFNEAEKTVMIPAWLYHSNIARYEQ